MFSDTYTLLDGSERLPVSSLGGWREDVVHARSGLFPRRGEDVSVEVHRDGDLRVSEDLHDQPRVNALGRQQRGAGEATVPAPE